MSDLASEGKKDPSYPRKKRYIATPDINLAMVNEPFTSVVPSNSPI